MVRPLAAWARLLCLVSLCGGANLSFVSAQVVEIPTSYDAVRESGATPDEADPIRLQVSRSARQLTLYRGETAVKTYPVAVGRAGWETPLGDFYVFQMMRNPYWKHPLTGKIFKSGDPGNVLGRYWIGFATDSEGSIGFHGTPHPKTVGKPASHGCIRMYEKDIEELFHQVELGTYVTVVP